jgi:hypothetical protein
VSDSPGLGQTLAKPTGRTLRPHPLAKASGPPPWPNRLAHPPRPHAGQGLAKGSARRVFTRDCARSKAFLGTDTYTFEGISTHLSYSALLHHRTVADFAYEVCLPFFGEKPLILSAALDPLPVASEVEIWFPAAIHRSLSGRIVGPNTTTRVENFFSAGGAPYRRASKGNFFL